MADGGTLGPKSDYIYTSDDDVEWRVNIYDYLAASTAGNFQAYDPAAPKNLIPPTLRMRYLNVKSEAGVKKRLQIGSVADPKWADSPKTFTVDGTTYTSTSRVGERRSRF